MSDFCYIDFGFQFLVGEWCYGWVGCWLKVSNLFDGSLLLEIEQVDCDDFDVVYVKVVEVQLVWVVFGFLVCVVVLYKVVEVFDCCYEEIVDWIICEFGSICLKVEIEWGVVCVIILELVLFLVWVYGCIVEFDVLGKESWVYCSVIGVVGVISLWNFLLYLIQCFIVLVLVLGNVVVVKLVSDMLVCGGLLLVWIFEEVGLLVGLFSVVVGFGSEIGDVFVEYLVLGLVIFIGLILVGCNIGCIVSGGVYFKYVVLELGGNSLFVVFGDVDLEQVVNVVVFGKFFYQGQICMVINCIIVEDSFYDVFVVCFVEWVKGFWVGDLQCVDIVVGLIVNVCQFEGLLEKICLVCQEGVKLLYEGGVDGQLLVLYVFGEVIVMMEIVCDEIFGLLVGLFCVCDEVYVLELVNVSEYGLFSVVFSCDLECVVCFVCQFCVGMIYVNDILVNDEVNVFFGGEKNFGFGCFNGDWVIEEFIIDYWISVQYVLCQYLF